ncbi:hypothetical protein ACFW2X_02165 [Streptomyces antibioticus]|uniref:hypothetical protein n=1 Tax=Streptomyces antibioticus TaxID=1890 RepID=UPI0036BF403F
MTCALCGQPVVPGAQPLAETPARYGDWEFTYRPTVCPECSPTLPRPVQLPRLVVERWELPPYVPVVEHDLARWMLEARPAQRPEPTAGGAP